MFLHTIQISFNVRQTTEVMDIVGAHPDDGLVTLLLAFPGET